MKVRWIRLALASLALLVLVACGSSGPDQDEVSVSISPEAVILAPGAIQEFTATVTGTSNTAVNWSATGGTLDGSENTVIYTAPNEIGEHTITATSLADSSKSAATEITVKGRVPIEEVIESIGTAGGTINTSSGIVVRAGGGVFTEATEVKVEVYSTPSEDYPDELTPLGNQGQLKLSPSALLSPFAKPSALRTEEETDPFAGRILIGLPLPEGASIDSFYLVDVTINIGAGETFSYPEVYYPGEQDVIELSANLLSVLMQEGTQAELITITVQLLQMEASGSGLTKAATIPHKGLYAVTDSYDHSSWGTACPGHASENLPAGIVPANLTHVDERMPVVLVTGWQTLANMIKSNPYNLWWKENLLKNTAFVPQVCGWGDFLKAWKADSKLTTQFSLFTFGYDSDHAVASNATRLESALSIFGNRKVIVVAHSMGGLVSHAYNTINPDSKIGYILTLGTPYRGTSLTSCEASDGMNCTRVGLHPEVIKYLNEGCSGDSLIPALFCKGWISIAKRLIASMASRQGDRDLAWEYGGDFRKFSYRLCPPSERLLCADYVTTINNPYLKSINDKARGMSMAAYTTFYGNIAPPDYSTSSWLYGPIARLLAAAQGQENDGIVPVTSACLSAVMKDNDCVNSRLPSTEINENVHHTELSGSKNFALIKNWLLHIDLFTEISASIGNLNTSSGNWRVTILYPSLLANPSTIHPVGGSAPVNVSNKSFTLDLTTIIPPPNPPVQLVTVNPPAGITVLPPDVKGANFSLIVFNDANGDGQLGSGEQFYLLNDPDNTFGNEPSRSLHLQYADKAHTLRGQSQTSTGTPVHWNVTAVEGWGRTIYQLADGGGAVNVSYSNALAGLSLQLGSSFTTQTIGAVEEDIRELLLFTPR